MQNPFFVVENWSSRLLAKPIVVSLCSSSPAKVSCGCAVCAPQAQPHSNICLVDMKRNIPRYFKIKGSYKFKKSQMGGKGTLKMITVLHMGGPENDYSFPLILRY